jgi:hypothetical protein
MKKLLLSFSIIAATFAANAQVSFTVLSPGGIAGDYNFEWADPAGGDWGTPDFNVANTNVQGFVTLATDGTAGNSTTPTGHPLANEACNPLVNNTDMDPSNDMTGQIAILYRGTCEFGAKALNAQNAGAIAVIIVNHSGDPVGMGGGASGTSVTIPVVMLSTLDGEALMAQLLNGPVEVFIGNKQNLYANDMGAKDGEAIVSDFGGAHSAIYNGFTPGIQVYNFGSLDNSVVVTATIDSPGGAVDYTSTVGPFFLASGDTLSIFDGNPESFDPWNLGIGNYPNGEYTLTYSLSIDGGTDEDLVDNTKTYTFRVNDEVISLSNLDASNMPVATDYPFNAEVNYRACMMFQEPNASTLAARGLYFIPYTDTAEFMLEGAEYLIYAYEWNDTWTDVTTPGFTAFSEYVTALDLVTIANYVVDSDDETGQVAYIDFDNPFIMVDNQRYLFCIEPTDMSNEISIGYDRSVDYDGNYGIYLQPISPVFVDDTWYTGWSGLSAPSIGLRTMDPASVSLNELADFAVSAYPNPATDNVTITVSDKGNGTVVVSDLSGKVVMTTSSDFSNGQSTLSISAFESGMYIFNVTMENGATAQFNIVKK